MHDVVPPLRGKRPANTAGKSTPNTVRLAWKLPARLRRPIERKPSAAPTPSPAFKVTPPNFNRRPLTTKVVTGQHTSDVHVGVTPKIRVAPPPYGKFPQPAPKPEPTAVARPPVKVPIARHVPVVPTERDVVYQFPTPKPQTSSPVSVSLWVNNKISHPTLAAPKKKISSGKLLNLSLLIIGCLATGSLVWNLQGLGRLTSAVGSITQQARGAYQHLLAARSALAETDFARSQQDFVDARQALLNAQAELDKVLASSQSILARLDVTGTVRSGQSMLKAGLALTNAGEALAHALTRLNAASPLGTSLVEVINQSKQDLLTTSQALTQADQSLHQVSTLFLPADIAATVTQLQDSIPKINQGLQTFLASSDVVLNLLGADQARQYLVLFANNHELRPIGGFIGSLGLIDIDQGRVENIDVQTVYDPDGQLKEFIAPPAPLTPITNRWYLRDANWFASYPATARKITSFFEKEGGPTVDGVMTITPAVIQDLLAITGPIELPAYNVTISAENFYEVTQREVTYEYDRTLNRPKQFLTDLTPLLLNRLFSGQESSQLQIISTLHQALVRKDLLLYFRDEQIERKLQQANLSGEFPPNQSGFFSINNANIGGHKSDQFMTQEIDYRSVVQGNSEQEVTVTIRRTHHGPTERPDIKFPPGEDPSQKDNVIYQRVFVPPTAQLIEAQGFTPEGHVPRPAKLDSTLKVEPDADVAAWQQGQRPHPSGTMIGTEAGYQFFANWQITRPGETSIGLYRYRLPAKQRSWLSTAEPLTAYVAKQAGAARTSIRISFNLPEGTRIRHTVPTAGITQDSALSFVYRGELTQDILVGAVYVRE